MTTSKVISLMILFMRMHVSQPVASASVLPHASDLYVKAQEAVEGSLERAKEMADLLTRTRAELGNATDLTGLDDCIKLAGVCVEDLTVVNSELAKGEGQLNAERADDIVFLMSGLLINEDTCLLGLPEEGSNSRLAEVVDNLIMTDKLFADSLDIVTKALKP